jgi:hypothetical protein
MTLVIAMRQLQWSCYFLNAAGLIDENQKQQVINVIIAR